MHAKSKSQRRQRKARRGSLTLELLFVLPILLIVLLATVEFSILGLAQQLVAASREGARVAALGGGQQDVQDAVNQFCNGQLGGPTIQMVITDSLGNPLPSGAPVTVTVALPATQAAPDLLGFTGISLADETIIAQTVMRKE